MDFNGINVPAAYKNMLVQSQFVVHGLHPAAIPHAEDSALAQAFNRHISAPVLTQCTDSTVTGQITVAEYFGGVGCATASLPFNVSLPRTLTPTRRLVRCSHTIIRGSGYMVRLRLLWSVGRNSGLRQHSAM